MGPFYQYGSILSVWAIGDSFLENLPLSLPLTCIDFQKFVLHNSSCMELLHNLCGIFKGPKYIVNIVLYLNLYSFQICTLTLTQTCIGFHKFVLHMVLVWNYLKNFVVFL